MSRPMTGDYTKLNRCLFRYIRDSVAVLSIEEQDRMVTKWRVANSIRAKQLKDGGRYVDDIYVYDTPWLDRPATAMILRQIEKDDLVLFSHPSLCFQNMADWRRTRDTLRQHGVHVGYSVPEVDEDVFQAVRRQDRKQIGVNYKQRWNRAPIGWSIRETSDGEQHLQENNISRAIATTIQKLLAQGLTQEQVFDMFPSRSQEVSRFVVAAEMDFPVMTRANVPATLNYRQQIPKNPMNMGTQWQRILQIMIANPGKEYQITELTQILQRNWPNKIHKTTVLRALKKQATLGQVKMRQDTSSEHRPLPLLYSLDDRSKLDPEELRTAERRVEEARATGFLPAEISEASSSASPQSSREAPGASAETSSASPEDRDQP